MIKKLTYIIPFRFSPERYNNLKKVVMWLSGFNNVDILVVEQDLFPRLNYTNLPIRHVFHKSTLPFNRSWGFNVGLKHANGEWVAFGDCDIIMNPYEFINAMQLLNSYQAVNPYKSVIDLTPQESVLPFNDIFNIKRSGRGDNDNQKINFCGGIVLYQKDAALDIGGWCEDFFGWGCEDNFQTHKTLKYLTNTELNFRCYHFYHTRDEINPNLYNKNLQILNKLINLQDQDLKTYIDRVKYMIGYEHYQEDTYY